MFLGNKSTLLTYNYKMSAFPRNGMFGERKWRKTEIRREFYIYTTMKTYFFKRDLKTYFVYGNAKYKLLCQEIQILFFAG